MSHRSVIETLDLHNDYGEYHRDACPAQGTFGWLSPRVSFSTEFIEFSPDAASGSRSARLSPDKKKQMVDEDENSNSYPAEFEFSMSSLSVAGNDTPGFIVPADELFHKGKLLPGYLPRNSTEKDDTVEFDTTSSLPEGPLGCPATTTTRQLNAEGIGGPSSLGCVLGPSCLRTPKGPKWRELFGALRRVKSDSGRQRIPDESLLPPKTLQGKKKFFKQIFGTGSGLQDPKSATTCTTPQVAPTIRTYPSSTATTSTVPSASQGKNSWDSSSSSARHSSRGTSAAASSSTAADFRNKHPAAYSPQSNSTESSRSDFRGKSSIGQSSDGFTFNPTRCRVRPSSSGTSSTNVGRVSPIKAANRSANFGRSPSGRVIVRGLDRVASGGRSSASLQEQVRALRSREIRRSPERSGYSNVRVTPVLNVPACMGPVLRGATKAGKGRLSNFRSFLTFKSKLPTSMSTTPIATR